MEAQGQRGVGGVSEKHTCDPFPPPDPLFLSGAPWLFPLVHAPPPLPFPVSLCVSPSFCLPFLLFLLLTHPFLSLPLISQAAKLPMSIIIIGVGQAEFDGKSPSPRCVPRGVRPLGMTLPQRVRAHGWV